jgi:hypothetical protein
MIGGSAARDVAYGPYTVRDLDALPEGGKGFDSSPSPATLHAVDASA